MLYSLQLLLLPFILMHYITSNVERLLYRPLIDSVDGCHGFLAYRYDNSGDSERV